MPTSTPWLDDMIASLGTKEVPGAKANPSIVQYFAEVGHPEVTSDEIAWCAARTGAALKRVGLPIPPKNVNLMARSYCTYGVKCEPKPGAIAIWPRGNSSWQGHVNIVETVTADGKVVCIGGNQSNAVTRTKPQDPSTALDFRWPVSPTVPDLRKAGSTEIKKGDAIQKVGIATTFLGPIVAWLKDIFGSVWDATASVVGPMTVMPEFSNINEGLTFWQTLMGGVNAVGKLVLDNPWLAGSLMGGMLLAWIGHALKAQRVAKAAAGVPLSVEVAAVEAA